MALSFVLHVAQIFSWGTTPDSAIRRPRACVGWRHSQRSGEVNAVYTSKRRCLACNSLEAIDTHKPIWPLESRCPACGHIAAQSDGIPMFAPDLADTVSGMDPKNFDELASLEAGYFWFVTRNELIVGLANKFFPQARRFLEIGCGTGAVLREMAGSRQWERLVGSELHPSGLSHARISRRPAQKIHQAAAVVPLRDLDFFRRFALLRRARRAHRHRAGGKRALVGAGASGR